LTAKKINDYYDRFKDLDAAFNREIIAATGLVSQQIQLKCGPDFFPCFVFSTSFTGARVIANVKSGILGRLSDANNTASLKFMFRPPQTMEQVAFFITTRVLNWEPYGESQDQGIFTLQYNQRPPDDLIEIMGRIFDATWNFARRREEKILVTPDMSAKIGLVRKDVDALVDGVPRRCILRELSFCGAKIIVAGVAKFLADKTVVLRLDFTDPKESLALKGRFSGSEEVAGRKDIVTMFVTLDEKTVPISYKIRVNECLEALRVDVKLRPAAAGEGPK